MVNCYVTIDAVQRALTSIPVFLQYNRRMLTVDCTGSESSKLGFEAAVTLSYQFAGYKLLIIKRQFVKNASSLLSQFSLQYFLSSQPFENQAI